MTDYERLAAVLEHLVSISYYVGCETNEKIVYHLRRAQTAATYIVSDQMRDFAHQTIEGIRSLLTSEAPGDTFITINGEPPMPAAAEQTSEASGDAGPGSASGASDA